jgi:glycosyltransferase involved in cell wall biosynthesis
VTTLHLPAIPHTVTRGDFSHCAFTGKVLRFGPMMTAAGYKVVHYGVGDSPPGVTEHVCLMTEAEQLALMDRGAHHADPTREVGKDARTGTPLYIQFNYELRQALQERVAPGDIVCVPMGPAHAAALEGLPILEAGEAVAIETGIGYPNPYLPLRVYESQAWRHWMMGREARNGTALGSRRREWVVPNYYDPLDWPLVERPVRERVAYLGRLTEMKGVGVVCALAELFPGIEFTICGQGDPTPFLTRKNITYVPPLTGTDRAAYLGTARAVLCPSRMVEPFCGVAVEAMLTGTPVITADHGAFTETVLHGKTGFRCGSLAEFERALEQVEELDRGTVHRSAVARYALDAVAPQYAAVFAAAQETLCPA